MSRRSVLLATTFYIAIGSWAAVGPASARGYGIGGFGGGQTSSASASRTPAQANIARAPIQSMSNLGGARFGHAPSIGASATENSGAGARIQALHIPAAANAPLGNTPAAAQFVRPAQLPQTITSSAIGALRRSVDAAGIVRLNDSVPTQIRDTGEGRGKLPNPGSTNGVPNVAGPDQNIYGPGSSTHGPKSSDGPTINLPGTIGQKGPGIPGIGDSTGVRLNLPGSTDPNRVSDGNKKLSEMENSGKALLDQATKGGPNSLNVPTTTGAGVDVSDNTDGKKSGSGGGSKPAGGTGGGGSSGGGKTGGSDNPLSAGGGVYGSGGTAKTKDGGTVTVSTMQDKGTTYQVVTTKDGQGNIISMTYSEKGKDGKVKTTSTGPEIPDKKDKTMPSEDGSGTIGGLNPSSGVGKIGQGGGTGNNTESSATQSTQLAPGSALGRRGNGDGTGGRGDNGVSNDGTLAAGSVLARKDFGDGGGSDTRNGSTTAGGVKVGPGGGDPHQKAVSAAAASRN